jgi:HEAT repeat protein
MVLMKKQQSAEVISEDQRKTPRDCASLAQMLEHADPTARRWAARDLVDCPQAAGALLARLWHEDDVSVREVIFSTLTCLGSEEAVAGLVRCLRSDNASLRNEAIEGMKLLPDEVENIIAGLLHDADADVRILAVNILESLRHPDVESWLIEVIENDPQVNVCGTAVDLLVEVGSVAARQPLLRLKARFPGEPYIQFAADLALQRIVET